ncbi:MerR family transcriptional regulator [Janibacter limosus]|uniref:MerR family transcriptional regulator n=1 Tax=Janibacter limosus TaxID=53458 RepID=UPI001FE1748D|nr:MerR family transcriptional regulator [Janibacter limosus]
MMTTSTICDDGDRFLIAETKEALKRQWADMTTDSARGVYGISVAADLVGMGSQQLRWYETQGLLSPDRTSGGTRRYSDDDLVRLRRIEVLLDAGLNTAGISMVIALQDEVEGLREELAKGNPDT